MRSGLVVFAVAALSLLAACTPAVVQPTANAGDPRTVATGDIVLLDGSKSASATKLPLTYLWTLSNAPAGSQARLTGTDVTNPSFVADVAGGYKVTLIVADKNAQSEPVTIDITATATDPVAYVYSQTGAPGTVIILDGSASKAPNGNVISYKWTVTDPAMAAVALVSPASPRPSFRADLIGVYAVSLVVNDGTKDSAPMAATVTISFAPQPPVASAGPSISVARGAVVNLNGLGSFDPDQTALTYAWTMYGKPTASTTTLTGPDGATPTFVPDVIGAYQISLTVTDASGARSAPSWVTITCVNNAPTASFTSPADVYENNPATFNASGSTDPDSDRLAFDWSVFSAPVGGAAGFSNQTSDGKADFTATQAGAYLVVLKVTDPQGNQASTTKTITVTRSTSFAQIAGEAQTDLVNAAFATPMTLEARIGSTPIPNANIGWRIQNGSFVSSMPKTDSTGRALAFVRAGRFSGTGRVIAWLVSDPAVSVTFNFTQTPGPVAMLTIGAPYVDAAAGGVLVQVRTADQFGNLATDANTATLPFQVTSNGPSVFDVAVNNGKGTLTSGGGTQTIRGALVAGEFEILVKETKPVGINLTLTNSPGSATSFPLPFARWINSQFDDAENVNLNGWTASSAASRPWAVKKGIQAAGRRSFGLERLAGEQLLTGSYATLSKALTATGGTVKMTMKHQLVNPSASNVQGRCSAHASAQVWMRNCTGISCGTQQLAAPIDGYDYVDSCDGQPGFASTTGGFVTKTFDLSDAAAAGGPVLSFTLQNNLSVGSPNPAIPNAAVSWYIDDVQAFTLSAPVAGSTSLDTGVLAGPLFALNWSQAAYGAVAYSLCNTGIPFALLASLRGEDARGNLARGVDEVVHYSWGAPGLFNNVTAGNLVGAPGTQNVDVQFVNGLAAFNVNGGGLAGSVTITAVDQRSQGLTVPAPVSMTYQALICHNNGLGQSWSDTTTVGTFNQVQGTRACEATNGINACVFGNNRVIGPLTTACGVGNQWIVAANSQISICGGLANALVPGNVLSVNYISTCTCGAVVPATPAASLTISSFPGTWN